jgi:diacylglycerol kinase family enzyme
VVGTRSQRTARSPILVVDASAATARATRAELCRQAQVRGWRVLELGSGDDYPEVDSVAAEHGAGLVAFVGADRSQSKATVVASGRELSYACLPAGRDDLFARDLGIDPDAGFDALAAMRDYCEYYVDLAEVNGVAFVNYAALGLDCTPAQADTPAEPSAWSLTSVASYTVACHQPPARLHWFASSERESCAALFVSNNRRRFASHVVGGRTRLDGGVLGIGVLPATGSGVTPLDCGGPWRELGLPVFEVDSTAAVRADVDGRVVSLEPPMRFRILPRALRVRIPLHS